MSHVHFCDGYSYGSDVDLQIVQLELENKYFKVFVDGNNGFFVLKDTNSGTDQSGQGNNLTVSGTLTCTHDNPSNLFCNLNQNTSRS